MDIDSWLRSLGLEQYEAAFRGNSITEKVLPRLTAEDLKDLGVTMVGHRRVLLDAIADLRSAKDAEAPSAAFETIAPPSKDTTAERRQVTVMFSDLVGSTALSARMDPEDLREIISAYQKCVAETVQRFGGFVAKYMGDGVLVYFGYPLAHEDDTERAVRAGLELVAAVGALKNRATLQTRVGIATGLVVVGDLIGSGASQEQAIVGETPNLAARLQGVAEPNTVVIAESTRKLLGNLFELEDLGAMDLKGIAVPVRAWAALRQASVEGRFEALHATGLTELVGREEELELLLRRWSKATSGEGQVVLVSGEPGIGKSRLIAALSERISTEPHTRLRYFCSPQHTDSALHPFISQLERAAGFTHDDDAQAKLDKLGAVLAQSSTSPQDVALLSEMLSLPNDGRYPELELPSHQRRQKTMEALAAQIEGLSHVNPILMIFEDVHWIDPTSLEALGRAVDQIRTRGALLIVTYRPEFQPPWSGQPHVTALTVNRLGPSEISLLIERIIGNKRLPDKLKQDIVERTDGIPLFVEEMTKAVVEAESEQSSERMTAAIPSPSVAVPASLHASLMARLDRLGPAKEVAQIAAVLGRNFSHDLLTAAAGKEEVELQAALDRLMGAGLLFRQGIPPHATYLFKHGLVQDAAYSTLLRERRRLLHQRIAEILETQFPEAAESQPELIARHCTEAGLVEKAVAFWAKAGRRSMARSALVEAVAQLTRALDQIATLPSTPRLRREQIELQVATITPLMHVKGYSSPEVKAATEHARLLIEQAEALGEPSENPLLLYSVLFGFWIMNAVAFNGDAALALAEQFLELAEKQEASVPLLLGHGLMGFSLLVTGNFTQSLRQTDQALALYDPAMHRPLAMLFGQDARVMNLSQRSMALWFLGYPGAALAGANQFLKEARQIDQVGTLLNALNFSFVVHFLCGAHPTADALANELSTLADEQDAGMWKPAGLAYRGWILARSGRASETVQLITSALAALRATGTTLFTPVSLSLTAKCCADLGQLDDAGRSVDEATTVIETTKETWFEADVYRIAGEVALKSPQPDVARAEACFERALSVARQQQAKSWELRAAISMARLWRDQGKPQQARELLAPIYGWFTEGFDTRDLKEAKALLEQLAT